MNLKIILFCPFILLIKFLKLSNFITLTFFNVSIFILLISDSKFIADDGGGGAPENQIFVMNAVDYLLGDKELISLRSREITNRPLQELEDDGAPYESIEEIWPDYPTKDDFFFNEDEAFYFIGGCYFLEEGDKVFKFHGGLSLGPKKLQILLRRY